MTAAQPFSSSGTSQDRTTAGADSYKSDGGQRRHSSSTDQSDLRHDAELAVKSAKETLGNVRDMAGDVYDGAKKSATNAAGTLNDAVVRNPWASVGIAAGAGFLLGLLLIRIRN